MPGFLSGGELAHRLVLNRWLLDQLGVENFEELKNLLRLVPEGAADDGQSYFFGRLAQQGELGRDRLAVYDRRVLEYERRLARERHNFRGFRYFQYLAVLAAEVYLDSLTADPPGFLDSLNGFLAELRRKDTVLRGAPSFEADDLRRLAFFMATGSGKTLLLHVNVWQLVHYLEHGRCPQALVRRLDGRRAFSNVLLITPSVGLSTQHLKELKASGLNAGLLVDNRVSSGGLFGPMVKVIEIHKLAEEQSKDGVSIALDELGSENLVIVDEGHKGTASEDKEEKRWKGKQQRLCRNGFLLEYSATFSQAIGTAKRKRQDELLSEYGKAILFDYSYAHFYGDGFGKNFRVLNLQSTRANQAHELMLGGLLVYYSQLELYRKNEAHFREYKIERPLWVLLGTSVSKAKGDKTRAAKTERTDIAEVLAFLVKFLEEPEWAKKTIARLVAGETGYSDKESVEDLFAAHLGRLRSRKVEKLYGSIQEDVFQGRGALELWEVKSAEGEIGLRVSAASGRVPYFGVINIGDVPDFRKHIKDKLKLDVQDDHITDESLFEHVDDHDSSIAMLIGAKKFIEGWSSWRVSSMGLMNVGTGEGSQVMQLFGRGVRLKGRDMSLKRSEDCADIPDEHKDLNRPLETLYIFGWNANYVERFREMLEREDIGKEFSVQVKRMAPWPSGALPVPQTGVGFDLGSLTWELKPEPAEIALDLTPRMAALWSAEEGAPVHASQDLAAAEVCLADDGVLGLVDLDQAYANLLRHKQAKGCGNVFVSRAALAPALQYCRARMRAEDRQDPEFVQSAVNQALERYFDDWIRRHEREVEFEHSKPGWLACEAVGFDRYTIRVKKSRFLKDIERLLRQPLPPGPAEEPLPRLHWDRSLFNPVLAVGDREWSENVAVQPPPLGKNEKLLLKDMEKFWRDNHDKEPYHDFDVFVLRNLPGRGVGLFSRSGFFPDFIVWLKHRESGAVHVRFLDPHGLHHDGLSGTKPKFDALRKLAEFTERPDFKDNSISLDGYILAATKPEYIVDRSGRSWADIERDYPVLHQTGGYVGRVLMPAWER